MIDRKTARLAAVLAALVAAVATAAPAQALTPPETGAFLHLISDPGDSVGAGEEHLYTAGNAVFTAWYVNGYFEARVEGADGQVWRVHMEAPDGAQLVPGTRYTSLALWPFNGSTGYGLRVNSSRSCVTLDAGSEITIHELKLRPVFPNEIERFDASFVQYCDGATAPLRGRIRIEPTPDTTPPTLYLPGDLRVEAADAGGAAVYYGAFGIDERDGYVAATCSPASGTIFPIGSHAVECTAADSAGNEAHGQFRVTVDPPFVLGVSLSTFGTTSRVDGGAQASGLVSCSRTATAFVTVTVTQLVANRATVEGSAQVAIACDAPSATWSADVHSPDGEFLPGKATVSVTAFSCPYYCREAAASDVVTLRRN